MKIGIFLILFTFCLYLADARGVDHSDNENPSDGSDVEGFDSSSDDGSSDGSEFYEGFSADEDLGLDDDENDEKHKEDIGLSDEQAALLKKVTQNQWKEEKNPKQSVQASDRLMKELRACYRSEMYKNKEYSIELVNESPYNWNVMVRSFDKDSGLYKDLQKLKKREGQDGILFNFQFGANYPFKAPFVRVVYPVIKDGFVFEGGAICMELLHPKGWSSVYTVEMIITQLTATIVDGKGRIAFGESDQGVEKAAESYAGLHEYHNETGWGEHYTY